MKDSNRKKFYIFLITVEFSLVIIAYVILLLTKKPLLSPFPSTSPLYIQLGAGIVTGALLGFLISTMVIKIEFFEPIYSMITTLASQFGLIIIPIP